MRGVKFNTIHSYDDLGIILSSKKISPPSVKVNQVEIQGTDGYIDLSEALTGKPSYNNRNIKLTFAVIDASNNWLPIYSKVMNAVHGKKMNIILDDDKGYYYFGRVSVNDLESKKGSGTIVVDCDVDAYKYDVNLSNEKWKWDSFCFIGGIAQDTTFSINGTKALEIYNNKMDVCPEFILPGDSTIVYDGKSYNAPAGMYKNYDIIFHEGLNNITITGTGTVSISFRGGSL